MNTPTQEDTTPRPVPGGWSLRGQVRGYKGGKGGGSSRTPVEAKDSLHSTSYARVLDLVSEGEIEGLVNGLQSIYLDGTPLQNQNGLFNFEGVTVDFRSGTPLQAPVAGFPASEQTTSVGVELKSSTPWVRAISNIDLSAVRIMLGVNGLSKANTSNGDINGHKVQYAIDLQTDGGAWQQVLQAAFSGKTTQQYRRSHRIDLPPADSGWSLRVRRLTANANSSTTADTTVIDSITEVIDGKLRYPMSALVGLQVDASQFRSIPQRAYHLRGRIIRVPSNYDPVQRSYGGLWDGTFKTAYSNNPAWVFYDLATNDRYGLGQRISAGLLNKWALYQIAVYCDELVDNGRGGQEPRFTCNAYLQQRGDAHRVLQDLCSIFRGMVYWAAGAAVPVADMPRDPVYTYTQANVIGGRFTYSGSRGKDRHTVALVSYNDLGDMGRQKVLYVQDDAAVARYGIQQIELSAFGCTSAAQARRVGQWALLTAQRETRSVAFSVGLDGVLCAPGKIIRVADNLLAGQRIGGRIRQATASTLVLDASATVKVGDKITAHLPNGLAQTRTITSVQAEGQHISVTPAFDAAPAAQSAWALDSTELATQLYTVVSVTEGEGLTFDIAAVQHEPGKFAHIDHAQPLPQRPITVLPARVLPTPTGITVQGVTSLATDGAATTTVTIAWGRVQGASAYDVQYSRSQSDWVQVPRSAATSVDITNAYSGDYIARVRAISPTGTHSDWAYSDAATITGQTRSPANYDSFTVLELDGGLRRYSFGYSNAQPPADLAGAQIRCIAGTPQNIQWQDMAPLGEGSGYYTSSFDSAAPEPGLWTFALRAVNRSGVLSDGMLVVTAQLFEGLYVADLTPPPAPTGVQVTSALSSVIVQWDSPSYTEGHGHQATRIYAAQATAQQPDPPRSSAKVMAKVSGPVGDFAASLGSTWQVWVTNLSNDGVESSAAGPFEVRLGMVGGHDLADDLDLAAKLADGSITASKLAAQAIDATKFANGIEPVTIVASGPLPTAKTTTNIVWQGALYTWDGSKYATPEFGDVTFADIGGQLLANQLADNAVTVAKIAAGAVDAGKLAAGAVTASKLAAQAIDATKFANGIEPVGIIASGGLPTVKSTSTIVYGGKLYRWDGSKYTAATAAADIAGQFTDDQLAALSAAKLTGQITGTQITDKAISTAKLAAAAVTANEIASNAVTAVKIAAGAIEAGKIAAGAVTADKIAANSVTTAKIAAGAVTATEIAANAVTATQLAANAVTAASIQAGEVTAGKLATDSVVAANIAANAVTTAKIATGAVTANEIASNAVTAVKIAAGAIEAGKIAAGAVTADKIAANSVTTAKIAAGAVTAAEIAADAITASKIALTDTTNLIADQDMLDSAAWSIGAGWAIAPTTLETFASANIGRFAYNAAATGNSANLYCKQFSVEPGSEYYFEAQGRMTDAAAKGAVLMRAYWYNGSGTYISNLTVGTLGLNGTAVITLGQKMVAPAGAKRALFAMAVVHGSTTGTVEAGGQVVRRMASAELIVDGAITATKLAANSIAVGTAAIQAGAIVNAHIGNLSADKITAGTLAAARIAAGSIDAGKLAANAVTADKIAANAVTAAKMSVASLSSVSANIGTVTAGRLQNAGNTQFLNLSATGAQQFIKAGGLEILANGTSTWAGTLNVKSATTGARLEIAGSQIRVYDANNVLRVRLGVW